ncbi:DEAD/DEAH box helicase [Collinsella aerofaciens]|uniref:DEAD/DEAH box helicase n=1 Tax=Collinsella aerofaciens TaxID=74426 RepID=UPI00321A9A17
MRNSVSDVTDAEILDETRETMTQAAFDAADEASAAETIESATENLPAFDELGLSDEMLRAIENLGYTAPTPVQAGSIPVVLEGRDLLAAAQTGTGKTAAFLLPTMNNLEHIAPPKPVRERGGRNRRRGAKKPEGNGRGPVMLVITPTRELAQQIDEVASKIADVTGHVAVTVVGGVSYKPQTAALKYGCDILVATPGRLVDLIEQGACHLGEVKVLVLDEADRMLDMGFLPAVRRIVRETPAERQTLLFSATLDEEAVGEITDLVSDPARVEIAPATSTADTVDQFVFPVSIEAKNNLLPEFLKKEGPERTIVFMRTKHRADSCCRRLERKGIKAAAIHGNRSQAQRERALSAFRDGTVDVLVATDVLARGIDISDVRYVVNFDVPAEPTDYIHRIGRTGRAGELGWAITFVTEQDVDEFYEIEKLMDKTADIYDAGDLHVGPNPPAVDPERDPAAFKVKKKTKRGKSKSKKKLEQARRDGKRNGDVAGRSNRGRGDGERPSRPKRGGKTRVREGVQARVDEAVESVAREVAAEERGGAGAVEQAPRGNRAERRAKQFQGEAHRRRREDEDRGGRRRVEREDEGRGSRSGKRGAGDRRRSGRDGERGGRDERRGGEGRGSRDERGTRGGESRGGKRFEEHGGRGVERRDGARGKGGRSGAGRSNESRDRRDPRASRDRRDDWRNYDDTREERRGGYHGGRGGNQAGSRGGRAGGRDNRGSYGNRRGGKRGGSSRRPGDGGGKRK